MPTALHIAALVPYRVYPARMGGQKGIALFYEYLSKLVPVTVISTTDNAYPAETEIKYASLLSPKRSRYIDPRLIFRLRKLIIANKYSHLIIEHPYYGWLGISLQKLCKIPLVVHSHNIESLRFRSTGKWWWRILFQYEKLTHRAANLNFFISDEDRKYAINAFDLQPARCHTITYGIDIATPPTAEARARAKAAIRSRYSIHADDRILFFNGTLDYPPNLNALDNILSEINPRLLQAAPFKYKIIICGKNLPRHLDELSAFHDKNIIYAGFVDDINEYFYGSDVFLNPVTDGGGIKTKLVEALAADLPAVSTVNGAFGVDRALTAGKLQIVQDGDWDAFTRGIFEANRSGHIPPVFFDQFFWGRICAKAVAALEQTK